MKKHGLGQSDWNAHQVYAWVYTRNPRLVVLLSDRDEGDSVEPSVIDFFAMSNRPGAEFADYAEAQEVIVSTLQEGRLRSLGRREGVGTLEEIPAVEWVDLHFVWSVFHGFAEAVSMTDDPPASIVGAPRWYGLRFKRDNVLELWPPTEIEIEQAEPAKADQAQTYDEPKTFRKRDAEAEAKLRTRIESVLAADRRKWPDPKKRPGFKPRAEELARDNKLKLGSEAIRKILSGTYRPMKSRGISKP